MNFSKMFSVEELSKEINSGKRLLVSGDEEKLKLLPKGDWIGGTIPYFMSPAGGVTTKDMLFATELPSTCRKIETKFYNETNISSIYSEIPTHGFSFIVLPATTKIHLSFATGAPDFEDFAARPLIGWVSGIHLNDLGRTSAKVVNGRTLEMSDNKAVVMQVSLDPSFACEIGIVNIFSQGGGDIIEFSETGFSVIDAIVNGSKVNFAEYVKNNSINLKLPLVANYAGAMINVSFQNIDEQKKSVNFYAPVFKGVSYRQASTVDDYVKTFTKSVPPGSDEILFSCNCILNYLYSELEGKKTGSILGPMTFGEVAYQLLNQTMVYLKVFKI
jgi:hypothetical protein